MTLRLDRQRPRHAAVLPSLGAAAVVAGVLVANLWSILTSAPELAPLEPLARLSVLQQSTLPHNAVAAAGEPGQGRLDAPAHGAAGLAPAPVRLSAATPGQDAPGPALQLTRSWVVQPGESLSGALARLYIRGPARDAVIAAYDTLRDPLKLQAGWRVWAQFETTGIIDDGTLLRLVVAPPTGEGLTIAKDGEAFVAREGGLPGVLVRQALRCGIVGSLEESLRRCGEGDELLGELAPLLADRLQDPIEPRTGDELRIVMDKLMDGDRLLRYHRIAALEYRTAASTLTALWFDDGRGQGGYYDPAGESLEPMFLRQPLQVARRTSGYGMRQHPVLHRTMAHYGVDFGAPRGTPVWSVGEGHLISARRAGAAGNLVRVRHDEQYMTEYMHLQRFASGLRPGERIAKGQVIGYVGSTGRSTGPHLHFGAKHRGRYVDPTGIVGVPRRGIDGRDRKAFAGEAGELLRLLKALGQTPGQAGS